ncbi:odorant receptor 4-like isoform X2 [Nomia melanderi]|uniref:odorant receptor 4-like isoform X2 n=1 Tax=Nomia melanderi TaxID=2448451 RepID=UPI0013046B56|nr:odorant receptor 82a-like [Nomia melanderi]
MTFEKTTIELDNPSDYSLQLNRWYLKPIGAWPASSSSSRLEHIVSIVLIVISYFAISFTVIPCIMHIVLEDEDTQKKLRGLGPLSHWLVGGINYTTLLVRSKQIRRCVEHLQVDWQIVSRVKYQEMMLKNARLGRYVCIFCAAFMQGGVLGYCLVTALSTELVESENGTRVVHILPCVFYKKVLNTDTSPTNELVLASQFLSGFIVNSSAVGAFSLAAVFAAHAYGQLDIVMINITELVNRYEERNTRIYVSEIRMAVASHMRALSLISYIDDMMSRICFSELFHCTIGVCFLGYYILTEWSDHDFQNLATYFMILCSMTFNIFVLCYIGEILTEQCKKVGETVYMTDWHCLPYKYSHDLLMIISRSTVMMKITAGKMVHMSIYTFGQVMKSSFAYLNLLRQTT